VADHDAVDVPLAYTDLIDADDARSWLTGTAQLLAHVLLLELLDRMPGEVQLLGDVLDGARAAAPANVEGKALGVTGIVGQQFEPLALHGATVAAVNAPHFQAQVDAQVRAREVAHPAPGAVVPAS